MLRLHTTVAAVLAAAMLVTTGLAQESSPRRPTPRSARPESSLAERLQAARRSESPESAVTPSTSTPSGVTATNNPAPERSSGSGLQSVLKSNTAAAAKQPATNSPQRSEPAPYESLRPEPAPSEPAPYGMVTETPAERPAAEQPAARVANLPKTPRPLDPMPPASAAAGQALLSSSTPQVTITATGPTAVRVGKQAPYTVTVRNESGTEAVNVVATIEIPGSVEIAAANAPAGQVSTSGTKITWTLDRLAARAHQDLSLSLIARQNQPFNLSVQCSARPAQGVARIEVQQPRLELAVTGPRDVILGDTAIYTFLVSNPGNGDAENVSIRLSSGSAEPITQQLGTLAAGSHMELPVELVAGEAGPMKMHAVVNSEGGLSAETDHLVTVRSPVLQVAVAGPELQYAGTTATYVVKISNTGDAPAAGVVVDVQLPRGLKPTGKTQALPDGRIQQRVADLKANAEVTFEVQCELLEAGEQRLMAKAESDRGIAASGSLITRVEAIADLKLTVNDPPGPIATGKDAVYELHIRNRGTKAAQQVQVLAQFSNGIEPISAEGSPSKLVPGQVLFEPIAQIAPGETITLKVTARADKSGNHRFRAEVKCDPDTKLVAEEATRFVD